jgi:hypothetical protein
MSLLVCFRYLGWLSVVPSILKDRSNLSRKSRRQPTAGSSLTVSPRIAVYVAFQANHVDRTAGLAGFPYFIAVINLPQRFQLVNGLSPVGAGLRLMPLLSFFAFG